MSKHRDHLGYKPCHRPYMSKSNNAQKFNCTNITKSIYKCQVYFVLDVTMCDFKCPCSGIILNRSNPLHLSISPGKAVFYFHFSTSICVAGIELVPVTTAHRYFHILRLFPLATLLTRAELYMFLYVLFPNV